MNGANQRGNVIDLNLRRPTRTLVHRKKRICAQVLPFRLRGRNERRPMLMRNAATLPPLLDGLVVLPHGGRQGTGVVFPPIEDGLQGKGLHVPDSAGDNYSRQGGRMIPVTGKPAPRTMCPMGRGVAPTRFKSEFAERLKAARIAAGYATQQEFALALGVPIERYKKWESGRTPMPHQYIPAACELTGQDANYFFKVAARAFRKTA